MGGFVNGLTFTVGVNVGVEKSKFEDAMSEADVTVSGKLLRV